MPYFLILYTEQRTLYKWQGSSCLRYQGYNRRGRKYHQEYMIWRGRQSEQQVLKWLKSKCSESLRDFAKCPSEPCWQQQKGCDAARGQNIFGYLFYSRTVPGIPVYFWVFQGIFDIICLLEVVSQISRFFLTFIEGYPIPSHVWENPKYLVIPKTCGLGTCWALPRNNPILIHSLRDFWDAGFFNTVSIWCYKSI